MVHINVETVVDLTSRFLTGMVDRGRGAVINIASTAAFQPLPGSAVYAASKSFVLSFSEAIRTELRGSGVTVTAVCPGPVRTEFTEVAGFGAWRTGPRARSGCRRRTSPSTRVDGAVHDRRVVVPGTLNRATRTGRPAQPAGARPAADQPDLAQRLSAMPVLRPAASSSRGASAAGARRSA